jgi:hypothetical protein
LVDCGVGAVDGHDDEGRGGGGVRVLVGRHADAGGRHRRGAHAVKAGPHELAVIADDHGAFGDGAGRPVDQAGRAGRDDPPMEEGVLLARGHAPVDPTGFLQSRQHGVVVGSDGSVANLSYPALLVRQIGKPAGRKRIGPSAVEMAADDVDHGGRDCIVHGGGGQGQTVVEAFRDHDFG